MSTYKVRVRVTCEVCREEVAGSPFEHDIDDAESEDEAVTEALEQAEFDKHQCCPAVELECAGVETITEEDRGFYPPARVDNGEEGS